LKDTKGIANFEYRIANFLTAKSRTDLCHLRNLRMNIFSLIVAVAVMTLKVRTVGRFVGPGLSGLLALMAVGAAVAIGVAVGGGAEAAASSPIR
jgi:hypothetical protein